jgi:hypothetical protein
LINSLLTRLVKNSLHDFGKGELMLWIDDVLDDLGRFCNENSLPEIGKKIEEARKVYYAELKKLGYHENSNRN